MSQKDKLIARLKKSPAPKDFTWDDLITIMRRAGFIESCKGGSHYMFEHTLGHRFGMSKTHPSGILKKYQIEEAIRALGVVNYGE